MQDRLAHQTDQFLKGVLAHSLGGIEHGGQSGIRSRPPLGAETAQDLAMNDRGAQSPFGAIVGWLDIRSVQEDEQAVTMFEISALQFGGLVLAQRALQEPIAELLQAADLLAELLGRQLLA